MAAGSKGTGWGPYLENGLIGPLYDRTNRAVRDQGTNISRTGRAAVDVVGSVLESTFKDSPLSLLCPLLGCVSTAAVSTVDRIVAFTPSQSADKFEQAAPMFGADTDSYFGGGVNSGL